MKLQFKNATVPKAIRLLNGMFNLTDTEIDILVRFIEYEMNTGSYAFSTDSKKQIANEMGKSDYVFLNTYIAKLKSKQVINQENKEPKYQFHYVIRKIINRVDSITFDFLWADERS
jgi:hypothetical protein